MRNILYDSELGLDLPQEVQIRRLRRVPEYRESIAVPFYGHCAGRRIGCAGICGTDPAGFPGGASRYFTTGRKSDMLKVRKGR